MATKQKRERITKGWYVEGRLPPDKYGHSAKVRSRLFHVLQAANDYRVALEGGGTCLPGSVAVRTLAGDDKLPDNGFW